MTTTTTAPTVRVPRPSWAVRTLSADGAEVDHVSGRVDLVATDTRPATSLQLVRADRIAIDDRGVAITPGHVRVEIEHLDRDVPVDRARTLLAGDGAALRALDALVGDEHDE
ncbi:MAG TPA: hypothetical protein VI248_28290 [Kineosporiaceae bacterium]